MDLPTPPLPDPMAMILSTPTSRCGPPCCGVGCWPILRLGAAALGAAALGAGPCAVITDLTERTPGSARKAASASACAGTSACASAGVAASITKRIAPSFASSARIKSRDPKVPPCGSATASSTALIFASSMPCPFRAYPPCKGALSQASGKGIFFSMPKKNAIRLFPLGKFAFSAIPFLHSSIATKNYCASAACAPCYP